MIKLDIGSDIYTILSTNPEISAATHNQIYPIIAEENTTCPFVVFQRLATNFIGNKDFIQKNDDVVEIKIVTEEYKEGVKLAEKICDAMLQQHNSLNLRQIEINNASEEWNENKFIQSLTFTIKY